MDTLADVDATVIKDQSNKQTAFLALLKELPMDHYNTLRALMLHLNRVMQAAGSNLMTSQNLGVVFGREFDTACVTDLTHVYQTALNN